MSTFCIVLQGQAINKKELRLSVLTPILLILALLLTVCDQESTADTSGGSSDSSVSTKPETRTNTSGSDTNSDSRPKQPIKRIRRHLYGIDISDEQRYPLDTLHKFQDSLSFIIAKATGGMTYVDKRFNQAYWQKIKDLGFTRGAYHFYFVWDDPVTQAQHFVSTVGDWEADDLPPLVDFEGRSFLNFNERRADGKMGEMDTSISIERVQRDLLHFLDTLKALAGRLPIIYVNQSDADKYLNAKAFTSYPLWIADPYTGRASPRLAGSWNKWAFWQKDTIQILNNRPSNTDLDEFHGDSASFQRFLQYTILDAEKALPIVKSKPDPSTTQPVVSNKQHAATRSGKLYGIDISDNQKYSLDDLQKFRDSLSFIVVKATGGITYVDKRFRNGDWSRIKEMGFTRGAYHFYYVWDDPIAQALHFAKTVGTWQSDDFPPIVDFEGHSFYNFSEKKKDMSIPIERVEQELLQFLEKVKSLTGRLPMIYVNRSNANKYLSLKAFNEYPLWIADPNSNTTEPILPENWKNKGWAIWQRGYIFIPNKGASHTDFDEFNGNTLTLRRFLQSTRLPLDN
ncbi:MAG: glycoside hydrolase family 25 protein [Lewinella sp.]|uniref:glycoside hydrolase family 25 protein n=1 Tax=Lewinella sp. TaxID=2004506 RepID=UPI003D6A5725